MRLDCVFPFPVASSSLLYFPLVIIIVLTLLIFSSTFYDFFFHTLSSNLGAVDAIKKEYESKVWTAPVPDVYQTETQYKAALEAANKQAEFFADYNAKLDKEIAGYDKLKREVGFMALNDYAFPGSSEEWEKNLEELNPYFSAEQEAALQSIDTAALSKDLKAGKIPDFPIRAFEAVSKDGPIQTSAASIQQEFQDYAKKYGVVLPSLKEVYEAAKVKAKLA